MNYECEQKLLWPGFKIIPHKYAAGISKVIENLGPISNRGPVKKCKIIANISGLFNKMNSLCCVHFLPTVFCFRHENARKSSLSYVYTHTVLVGPLGGRIHAICSFGK